MGRSLILCWVLLFSQMAWATSTFEFNSEGERLAFEEITSELRCLVCQNQNLAESHAQFAEDLKGIIFQKIKAGNTKQEVVGEITEKFGDYIHYQPPFRFSTVFLWFGPFLFFIWLIFWQKKPSS